MDRIRRRFISGIGAAAIPAFVTSACSEKTRRDDVDLIVVGGGTAGIPTAVFAAERLRVLVIDKGPVLGGTLDRSTGQIAGANTVFQTEKGIVDSANDHYEDILRINHGTSDLALTRRFVEHAGDTINWLADNGYRPKDGHPVTGEGHEHFRIARYLWGEKGGWSIFEAMYGRITEQERSGNLHIRFNTEVEELIIDRRGAVRGVRVRRDDGTKEDLYARKVVLATGGCAANPRMFESLHGVPLYCQIAHPNSQGAGLTLGESAGGFVHGGEGYLPLTGAVLASHDFPAPLAAYALVNPAQRQPWELLINAEGKRFVREDHPSIHHIEQTLAAQPGHTHWVVFDTDTVAAAPPLFDGHSKEDVAKVLEGQGMVTKANTIHALAERTNISPDQLLKTVSAYNEARENKVDDPLGRVFRPQSIARPPFYAVKMHGWTVVSFAGLAVDPDLRVIKPSGEPIKNLYAVGEVLGASATSGHAYTNGMLVTPALTFGRLLGQTI